MAVDLIDLARAGDAGAFGRLVEPHRRELLVHCYRLLGSTQDAEDALQESLVAAWQGQRGFEGRASIRTWFVPGLDQLLPQRAACGAPPPGGDHGAGD